MLQLLSMRKSEDGIKRRGDFFWSVVDFSFEKDTIGHIFTGQYYGLQSNKCQFYSLWCDAIGVELTIYRHRSDHVNYYTTDVVPFKVVP
jgi:hypothetical protein